MDPEGEDWQPVIDKLTLLRRGWPNQTWTWDPRFTMLASSFDKSLEMAARASAAHVLTYSWDSKSVDTAPAGLREICEKTGGLRAKQMLMAGKAGPLVVVGLWWPWGDGNTITLRFGLGDYGAMEEPFPQVRTLFGVDMR